MVNRTVARNGIKYFCVLLFVSLVFSNTGFARAFSTNARSYWKTFITNDFGYQIDYPEGFTPVEKNSTNSSNGVPSDVWFGENIHVLSILPALSDETVLKYWKDANTIELGNGVQALRRESISSPEISSTNPVETIIIEYLVGSQSANYVLTYNARLTKDANELRNRQSFEQMVSSFTILAQHNYQPPNISGLALSATGFDFLVDIPDGGARSPAYASYNANNQYLTDIAPCYNKAFSQLQHTGEDWFRSGGTNVYAVANGQVIWAQYANYPGAVVIIEHTLPAGVTNPWGGNVIYSVYSHLNTTGLISAWSDVTTGQLIGTVLDQGPNSHIHFEMRGYGDMTNILVCPVSGNSSWPGPGYTDAGVNPDTYRYTNPSAWIDSHRTAGGACPGPALTSPSDGYISTEQTISFNWSVLNGCTFSGYTFRIKDTANMDSGGTTIVDTGEGGNSHSETIGTLWNNLDLYWGVRAANATNGANWSVWKFRVEAGSNTPPAAPGNLTFAGATASSVTLNWDDNSSDEDGFKIYRWGENNGTWAFLLLDSVGADVSTYTQNNLSCGNDFNYYEVSAYNGNGESAHTTWTKAITSACPYPDLTIPSISYKPAQPNTNDNLNLWIDIQNPSSYAVGAFSIDVYIDNQPAGCSDWGEYYIYSNGLPANSTATYDFLIPAESLTAGDHQIRIFVDSGCEVTENDETDNIFGPIDITIGTPAAPPAHDDFSSAHLINALPETDSVDVSGATRASDDPVVKNANCSFAAGLGSVWYAYTPTANTEIKFDTLGSNYDTYLAVWTGSRGSLSLIGCNDDFDFAGGIYQSVVQLTLSAGTKYYIEVAEYDGVALSASASTANQPSATVPDSFAQNDAGQKLGLVQLKPTPEISALSGGQLIFHATATNQILSGNAGIPGAILSYSIGAIPMTAVANVSGAYSFTVPYDWSGTVIPSKTGYSFTPNSRLYVNVHANQTAQNFTGLVSISGSAGVAGATLSYVDGSAKTITAGTDGLYSFKVPYSWSGVVTPSKAGYVFSPTSKSYTMIIASQSAQNYTATNGYFISGNVGVPGALITYKYATFTKTVIANSSGLYSFLVPPGSIVTVIPSKLGYAFTPSSRLYTKVLANMSAQNFTGLVSISGSAGVAGATLSYVDGSAKTITAGTGGLYSFKVPYGWSGVVTPSRAGYAFSPTSKSYTKIIASQSAQNYTATDGYFIAGNVSVPGTLITYKYATFTKTVIANSSGLYSFLVPPGSIVTVIPSKPGYAFTPSSRLYTKVLANMSAQNFTALVTISGNTVVAGVVLKVQDSAGGAYKTYISGTGGLYSFKVLYGWYGSVTPSRSGYVFAPGSKYYSKIISNQSSQNYTATAGYFISGSVTLPGAVITYKYSTITKTVIANSSGLYSIFVPPSSIVTVIPSKSGYAFTPSSRLYTKVLANKTLQNFSPLVTISGKTVIAGVVLVVQDSAGSGFKTYTSGTGGVYSFTVPYGWYGSVTPSKTGYVFLPGSKYYSKLITSQISQNYTATAGYLISGYAGMSGVVLTFRYTSGLTKTTTANSYGLYSFIVPSNSSFTVIPSLAGFSFTPSSRLYLNVLTNKADQNFEANYKW